MNVSLDVLPLPIDEFKFQNDRFKSGLIWFPEFEWGSCVLAGTSASSLLARDRDWLTGFVASEHGLRYINTLRYQNSLFQSLCRPISFVTRPVEGQPEWCLKFLMATRERPVGYPKKWVLYQVLVFYLGMSMLISYIASALDLYSLTR